MVPTSSDHAADAQTYLTGALETIASVRRLASRELGYIEDGTDLLAQADADMIAAQVQAQLAIAAAVGELREVLDDLRRLIP